MIREIVDLEQADALLARDEALLYKHSPACWQGMSARRQVRLFAERHPQTAVYMVDVLAHREVSRYLATRLRVTHESPQVILLRRGTAIWSAAHSGVRARALAKALTDAA